MRNYIQVFVGNFAANNWRIYKNMGDLIDDEANFQGSIYLVLDKGLVTAMASLAFVPFLNNPANNGMEFFRKGTFAFNGPGNTPRDGWIGSEGHDHFAPPSDKPAKSRRRSGGVNVTIDVLEYLTLLLQTWLLGSTTQGRRLGGTLVPQRFIETLMRVIKELEAKQITPDKALAEINALK